MNGLCSTGIKRSNIEESNVDYFVGQHLSSIRLSSLAFLGLINKKKIYIYVYMHDMYVYVYVYICIYMYMYMFMHIYVYVYIYICICMYMYMYVYVYVCIYMYMYIYVYIYIYIYIWLITALITIYCIVLYISKYYLVCVIKSVEAP